MKARLTITEVAERFDIEITFDLVNRHVGSDKVFLVGRVDTIIARPSCRWCRDQKMHFFGASLSEHRNNLT